MGVGVGTGVGVDSVELSPFVVVDANDDFESALPAPQPAIPRIATSTTASLQLTLRLTRKIPPGRREADAKVRLGELLCPDDQPNALL